MSVNTVPKPIVLEDSLTRFLCSDSDFSVSKKLVKERAFRPRDSEDETSVFLITSKNEQEIWNIGAVEVLPLRKKSAPEAKIHARADFNAAAPISLGLTLENAEPPVDHVVIKSWPAERHARMQLALELAARSFLQLPAPPKQ